jgi:hypothetical protein
MHLQIKNVLKKDRLCTSQPNCNSTKQLIYIAMGVTNRQKVEVYMLKQTTIHK